MCNVDKIHFYKLKKKKKSTHSRFSFSMVVLAAEVTANTESLVPAET